MWLKNQPVYDAQINGGGYEQGKELAATKADCDDLHRRGRAGGRQRARLHQAC
jgi:hypothetical protein